MEKGPSETHNHCDDLGTRFNFIDFKRNKETVSDLLISGLTYYSKHKACYHLFTFKTNSPTHNIPLKARGRSPRTK